MKKSFKLFFSRWWPPALCFFGIFGFSLINNRFNIPFLNKPLSMLSGFSVLIMLVSVGYLFYKHRYFLGFLNLLILIFLLLYSLVDPLVDGDHWADNLKIPTGIIAEKPIGNYGSSQKPDSIINERKTKIDLVLYNAGQPGMYSFDVWLGKIGAGELYLKAFELTKGTALSEKSLKKYSRMRIRNPNDSIVRMEFPGTFTIYEGDWGKFYAARFEVWFKPDPGEKDRKILEKNFIIEGWMN